MEAKTKNSSVCMACACPCEKHKEHMHGNDIRSKHEIEKGGKTCNVCRADDKDCKCD